MLVFRSIAEFKGELNQMLSARGAVILTPPALHGVGGQEDLNILNILGRMSVDALTAGRKEPRGEDRVARAWGWWVGSNGSIIKVAQILVGSILSDK